MYNYSKDLDSIDAMIHNSDWLMDQDNLNEFKHLLERWKKQTVVWQERINEDKEKQG